MSGVPFGMSPAVNRFDRVTTLDILTWRLITYTTVLLDDARSRDRIGKSADTAFGSAQQELTRGIIRF